MKIPGTNKHLYAPWDPRVRRGDGNAQPGNPAGAGNLGVAPQPPGAPGPRVRLPLGWLFGDKLPPAVPPAAAVPFAAPLTLSNLPGTINIDAAFDSAKEQASRALAQEQAEALRRKHEQAASGTADKQATERNEARQLQGSPRLSMTAVTTPASKGYLEPDDAPPPKRSSGSNSPHSSTGSGASNLTLWRLEVQDVLGTAVSLHVKGGGERRLVASVAPDDREDIKSVISQAGKSGQLAILSEASEFNDGMASVPVMLDGVPRTAFLSFGTDGRVTTVDVSDDACVSLLVASDPGGSSAAARPSVQAPPLVPVTNLRPRVDISGRLQRRPLEGGRTAYNYAPVPGLDHGLEVQARPNGELWLVRIKARPDCSATHGSGTDMILGMARRLNEDGVAVRSIVAAWLHQLGMDGEFTEYNAGIAAGLSSCDAAMATFSGKVARLFGFTDVGVQQDSEGNYSVSFKRPGNA